MRNSDKAKTINDILRALTPLVVSFVLFIVIITLGGCSNLFDSFSIKADEPNKKDSISEAYISLSPYKDARSALPSIATENYTYLELTGRNRSEENPQYKSLGTWISYENMLGSRIPVSTGIWDFTLNARCGGAVLSCDIDGYEVRLGTNSINFQLSVVSYSTEGFGNLSFAITYPSNPAANVTAQFLEPGTLAPLSDEEQLPVTYGADTSTAVLMKNQMQSGTYVLKLAFISTAGLKLNTYSEIIVISEDLNTVANRRLSSLNEIYTVRYVLNGGTFANAGAVQSSYTRKSSLVLPGAEDISRSPYIFAGWYDNPSYQDKPVKSIKKGTAGNIVLYAKWVDSENQVVAPEQSVTTDTLTRISCPDLLQMTLADSEKKITASLINYRGMKPEDFVFTIDDTEIATIEAQSANGTAFISPSKKGFTELTVRHVQSNASKKVLVFVGQDEAGLNQSLGSDVYFIASDNVVSLNRLNESKTIKLTARNLSEYECGNIVWTCSNPQKSSVIGNGTSATVISLGFGTVDITASHPDSLNSMTFHVYINDPAVTYDTQNTPDDPNNGGTNEPDPLGIVSRTPYYLVSSLSSGITVSSGNWTIEIQNPTEDKIYLWSYTHIVYSDGTYTDTTPCIIGTYGRNGVNGTDGTSGADGGNGLNGVNGVGITAMKAYYLISSSMTSVTLDTSGWSEVPVQPTEELKYLWSYTKVIYSDGTYTNTEPCIIGTWSASGTSGSTGNGASTETSTKYITTGRNYYAIQTGTVITLSATTAGISAYDYDKISWTTSDESVIEILAHNGLSASVKGKSSGTAYVEASYPGCGSRARITVDVSDTAETHVYISTSSEVMQLTSGGQPALLQAVLVNSRTQEPRGFSFSVDNSSVAEITAQTESGSCYVKPLSAGQAQITVSNAASEFEKKVLVTVANSDAELADMLYLTTGSNVVTVGEGNTKTVSVSVRNSKDVILNGYTWSSSNPTIVSVTGNDSTAILNGNGIGTAIITCRQTSCSYPLNIIVQCIDPRAAASNPYIQLSASVINLSADGTYTDIKADLIGGSSGDFSGFSWASSDSAICSVYGQNETGKLKAISKGTTYITVSHPKASYPAQILVICDEPVANDCYISVPSSIITMKPTDGQKTITASLVNGSQTDRYNFSWSLDVYDVIDFQYAANVCTITPKQAGSVTITVSHPKAAYDQQIIVNVQQYANFAFPGDYLNITEGSVQFLNMEIPVSNISTYVRYYLKNPGDENIVSVTGTKNVAQITGVGSGSCTIYADLIATCNGTVQASDELLVYVRPKPAESVYITSSNTINTIQRGKSQTISAYLTGSGITQSDQYNLKWSTTDTDVITIGGLGADGTVTGNSIYVTAKNISGVEAREAIITCTHEKAPSALQFYVFIPGAQQKYITINKAMINLTKGSSGTTLSATIDNAESREDYNDLKWSSETTEGTGEIVRILGSGQTVQIYPVGVGECTVKATLEGARNDGICTVIVSAPNSFAFEDSGTRITVLPVAAATNGDNKKTRKFTYSPPDAELTFSANQADTYFNYSYTREKDSNGKYTGNGVLTVEGIKVGSGTLTCVTDGNARGQVSIGVDYDSSFEVQGLPSSVTIQPVAANTVGKSYNYQIRPAKDFMEVRYDVLTSGFTGSVQVIPKNSGEGIININPDKEYAQAVKIKLYAYDKNKKQNIGERTVTCTFQYSSITPSVTLYSKDGSWSKLQNGNIIVGDGESITLKMTVLQSGANFSMENAAFVRNNNATTAYGNVSISVNKANNTFTLTSDTDTKLMGYRINSAYRPVYYPNGKEAGGGISITNFKDKIKWWSYGHNQSGTYIVYNWHEYCTEVGLLHIDYTTDICGSYSVEPSWNYSYKSNDQQMIDDMNTKKVLKCRYQRHDTDGVNFNFDIIEGVEQTTHWSKESDPNATGKFYSESEFKSIAWYYCPGFTTEYCTMLESGIMTENVSATWTSTTDTTEKAYFHIGDVQYNLMHNGQYQQVNGSNVLTIPVYLSVRNCAK